MPPEFHRPSLWLCKVSLLLSREICIASGMDLGQGFNDCGDDHGLYAHATSVLLLGSTPERSGRF
jgi:hypothetical protein